MSTNVRLGTIVEVPGLRPGAGPGSFGSLPNGKSDGSVAGVSYFTCKPNYGIFVRTSQIKDTFGSEDELQRPPPTARPSFADEPGSRMSDGEDE
ncbi:hypothetical protein B0H14DRAFT_3487503 [Mycena olivaceomarginata]|nr:hypothetical protein B0H14DRAFT_3487503 [Mycena olivaceomarginata]